jgi:glycosyl transferase family 87
MQTTTRTGASSLWFGVRSGNWLTPARARGYSMMLIVVCGLAMFGWIAAAKGLIDRNGKPIGTDFSSFYAAGWLALEGHARDVYDPAAHHAREQATFGADTPYYTWNYPPLFLFVAAPLALLPYSLALAIFQGATLALYLWVIALIVRPGGERTAITKNWLPIAIGYPAVFINMGHGQNGLLSAGLLGAALVALPRRPLMAGLLMGLVAYKPQFFLVIPFALLAGTQWRALLGAGLTILALAAASCLVFGADCWAAFLASTESTRKILLEQGGVGFEKLQSAFAFVRMWGGSEILSYVAQGATSAGAICGTIWVWRRSDNHNMKSGILLAATALASPYILDYDLVLLAPAIAFLVQGVADRPAPYEVSLLAFVWIAPLFARTVAGLSGIPVGLLASLTLFAVIMRGSGRRSGLPLEAATA